MHRFLLGLAYILLAARGAAAGEQYGAERTVIDLGKYKGFILQPAKPAKEPRPWVWYAPTIGSHPNQSNEWVLRKMLDSGFCVCGINVGESYGSPEGCKAYLEFHRHVVREYRLEAKARLLAQSRGGLMLYNWAAENPDKVRCIVGIYPVCDLRSYPGLTKAAGAYGMTPAELEKQLSQHNPIDRLEPLVKAGVPILHIHGNADTVVPMEKNSQVMLDRYSTLGGKMKLIVIAGKGHAEIPEYFQEPRLVRFLIDGGFSEIKQKAEQQGETVSKLASKERLQQVSELQVLAQQRPEGKKVDALITQLMDEKASWENRFKAEDDLATLTPEVVMPRLLRHAARKMPEGGIYNSEGRDADKAAPVRWQIWYAVRRSWSEQISRLPIMTGGDFLVELLGQGSNDAEKYLVMQELGRRWSLRAEEPTSKILLDPAAAMHLRVSAAWALVTHGKQAYQDELLKIYDGLPHADRFDWFEALTSQRSKKRHGLDRRVVVRGFALLKHEDQLFKKEVAKRSDAFHGGYFATNWLADYLDEKFQPNADDPRYNNTGRRDPRWFADTVTNALAWWERNKENHK